MYGIRPLYEENVDIWERALYRSMQSHREEIDRRRKMKEKRKRRGVKFY